MTTNQELSVLIGAAKFKINILGVVPLDADWDAIVNKISSRNEYEHLVIRILCESDNMLFNKAFTSDTDKVEERRNFRDLKFIRDEVSNSKNLLTLLKNSNLLNNTTIEIMHLNIPISAVEIDDKIFINYWLENLNHIYFELLPNDSMYVKIRNYIDSYFDEFIGRKYSSLPNDELLELFDHERTPRGIYPRQSFYDTDYSQLVVWALIFDREGRLLIHRRSENAKDNRSMWDKSVGGHLDIKDLDTAQAIVREVIEELYQDEIKEKTEFHKWVVTDKDIIHLGDWRPDQRGKAPFREILNFKSEWCYFKLRLPDGFQLYSPRTLSDNRTRRLRVIPEVFLFVAGDGLNDKSIQERMFSNSPFKLINLAELKNAMDKSLRSDKVEGFFENDDFPKFTPDLVNIMTGHLRDTLEEFSQFVKRYIKEGKNA